MLTVRPAAERGHADLGWLDSYHSFSFSSYYDPAHMGFRSLRVINDDRVAAGKGFPTHPHRDMEIITYVLDGAVAHRDSLGTGAVVRPGEVQRMSAGSGVRHSEFNPSADESLRLLQIWIEPRQQNTPPSYEQRAFPRSERLGKLRLVGSPDGRDGSVTIQQDVRLYSGLFEDGESASLPITGRHVWVQVARGSVRANGQILNEGDGAALTQEDTLELRGVDAAEVLVFDLA